MNEYTHMDYSLDLIRIKEVEKSIRYIKRTKKDSEFLTEYQTELKELNIKKEKANLEVEKRVFLGMLKFHIPLQKNPNPKRIYGIFKGKYGCFPENSYSDVAPIEPDALFLNYMKYCRIKYAKRKNKT